MLAFWQPAGRSAPAEVAPGRRSQDGLDPVEGGRGQGDELKVVQESAPHWLQAGFALELLMVHRPVGIRGGPQRVLLQLIGVDPPRGADLSGRGAQRPGNLGLEDPPVVADRTAGRAATAVGPPLIQQQVKAGDVEPDLFGDLVAGCLFGPPCSSTWPATRAIPAGGVARLNTSRPLGEEIITPTLAWSQRGATPPRAGAAGVMRRPPAVGRQRRASSSQPGHLGWSWRRRRRESASAGCG